MRHPQNRDRNEQFIIAPKKVALPAFHKRFPLLDKSSSQQIDFVEWVKPGAES
jgi:hypothetical protein